MPQRNLATVAASAAASTAGAAAGPPAGVAAEEPHVPPPTRVVPFLHNELHEVRPEYDYDWTLVRMTEKKNTKTGKYGIA